VIRRFSAGIIAVVLLAATAANAEDLRPQWAHLNAAKQAQKSCHNAMTVRNWGEAIAYCQHAAETWAVVADDDDVDPYMSQRDRDTSRATEGDLLCLAASAAWYAGLKNDARGFLHSARSLVPMIHARAVKNELLSHISVYARVVDVR
jgi:hypothetical protein